MHKNKYNPAKKGRKKEPFSDRAFGTVFALLSQVFIFTKAVTERIQGGRLGVIVRHLPRVWEGSGDSVNIPKKGGRKNE